MDACFARRIGLLALCAALVSFEPARAAEADHPASLTIPKVASAPSLDPKAPASAWAEIPSVTLDWDVQHQRPSSESSVARIATDGKDFFLRFDVKQREGLLQQQRTNNVGDGTDDEVWVDFWHQSALAV